jgi:DNA modification methylase
MREAGWLVKQCLIWVKNSIVMGRQDYHWQHEPILYGWKPGSAHKWYSDRKQSTVLNFDRPSRSTEHPTMKPIPLFQYLLEQSSTNGDHVADPFAGSGTTLIAAHRLNRKARLLELDPKYCDVIIRRFMAETGDSVEPVLIERDGKAVNIPIKDVSGDELAIKPEDDAETRVDKFDLMASEAFAAAAN